MKLIKDVKTLREIIKEEKRKGKTIGFVPTMGYLHEGHLSLLREAKKETDFVVLSIFVNPIQFGPNEDLDKYPRDIERDSELARQTGCDLIFNPEPEEVFPKERKTSVIVNELTEPLCGRTRPGHFEGVTTIVAKLFNMVAADKAFFGQKDAQQAAVIIKMVDDLNFDLEIVVCPIVREQDGLAMSSRNVMLNEEEREQALALSRSLQLAEELIVREGLKDPDVVIKKMEELISSYPLCRTDYIEILDFETLQEITEIKGTILIALAVKLGPTRLIDNKIMGV